MIIATATVLRIIELSLAIVLEAMQGMTPEQKSAAWERHEARLAFWSGLIEKVKD